MWIHETETHLELMIGEHEINDFGRPQRLDPEELPSLHQVMSNLPGRIDAGVARPRTSSPTLRFQIGTLVGLLAIAAAVWL